MLNMCMCIGKDGTSWLRSDSCRPSMGAAKPNNPVPDWTKVTVMGWGLDSSFFFPDKLQEVCGCGWVGGAALPLLLATALRGAHATAAPHTSLHCPAGLPNWSRLGTNPLVQADQQLLPLSRCQQAWGEPNPPWMDLEYNIQPVCAPAHVIVTLHSMAPCGCAAGQGWSIPWLRAALHALLNMCALQSRPCTMCDRPMLHNACPPAPTSCPSKPNPQTHR